MLSCFSHIQLFSTLWTVACQAPLPMGFSRQEYWSGFPCPSPEHLLDPRITLTSLMFPALADRFFTTSTTGKPIWLVLISIRDILSIKLLALDVIVKRSKHTNIRIPDSENRSLIKINKEQILPSINPLKAISWPHGQRGWSK